MVSSTEFNENSADVWIVVITSQSQHAGYKIPLSSEDLSEGTLLKNSFVKFSSLAYMGKNLLGKKVAQVKTGKMLEINKKLIKILDVKAS